MVIKENNKRRTSIQEIYKLVEEKIDEIFLTLQNKEGITSGDITPGQAFELDDLQEKLAKLIDEVIQLEKGWWDPDEDYRVDEWDEEE